ncbi:MAG: penicillin-binding protein 1A, partial [Gemmatimonadota bacterium]
VRRGRRRLGPGGERVVALGVAGVAALGLGLAWGTWSHVCHDCPSIAQIYAFEPREASRVYAADGSLLAELAVERRTAVPYGSLPAHLPAAFVAVEDRRFWSHPGVDFARTFRVGIEFLFRGYDVAGASTITQQLAGNMFSGAVDRSVISVHRKLKEMRVAFALERAYTKREILQAYMNQINFGDGHYGVLAAADYYFKKDVRELNLAESAMLAALPRAPQRYSPIDHPDRALQRRNLVLEMMADQDMISRSDAEAAKAQPLGLRSEGLERTRAPYFVEWVRRELMDRYGPEIYEAGYRVYTTLDPQLQSVADSALQAQLRWIEGQPEFDAPTYDETRSWSEERMAGTRMEYVQGAFIAMDPTTGDVLALIGGRDYEDSEFNRATQALRQPGSVFKPFVYTAAVASGIPASQVFVDAPVELLLSDSTIYSPKNFGDRWWGPVTARQALYNSINVVAVKVGQEVGEEAIAQYARDLGVATDVPRVPSVAIGAASVKPIEITEAYSTFANAGVRAEPRPILRVESSDGEVLWESGVQLEEVLDRRTSWIMLSMLRDVVDRGTGSVVRNQGVSRDIPVAGKTGTTNDATDAWFVGFTPEIVTTTWVGLDNPAHLHRNAQGGRDAAPVNAEVLKAFYRARAAPEPWARPEGIAEQRVDRTTGLRATEWCPADSVYTEYFIAGTEPRSCDVHGPFNEGVVPDEMPVDTAGSPRPRP